MKKLLLLQIIVALCAFKSSAMDQKIDEHMPNPVALSNFTKDKSLINKYLDEVKDAQLHFFWTTGRTISDNPDYKPITKVEVGGSNYGRKFFPYVEELLKNSPDKLKIVFVCDTMTVKSNEQQINLLQLSYRGRFELSSIEGIHQNLLKIFYSPEQVDKINVIFKNATQGSPVIASDIYRIIGMIYGQTNPSDPTGVLRTYCDIDAFCYGMEQPTRHIELIEALFRPVIKSPFYFGRSHTNNDIIKIYIKDINPYKEFCIRQLAKINTHKRIFPEYNKKSVTRHFSDLHDMIKQCEKDPSYCLNISSIIPMPIFKLIQEVTQNTGPQFLYDHTITYDLSYPSETVGAWGAPEEVLDHRFQRHICTHPPSVLYWGYGDETLEEKEAFDKFINDCDKYRRFLGVYFYAKQFGENHPFNLEIKRYLLDHYPYNGQSFKTLLKLNFTAHNKSIKRGLSYEEWKEQTFKDMTTNTRKHYVVLNDLLQKLGIEFPMTLESLDF